MGEVLILEGTKRQMAEQLAMELDIPKEQASTEEWMEMLSRCVDYLARDRGRILTEDEAFYINQPSRGAAENEWVSGNADYYICIKKATFLLLLKAIEGTAELKGLNPIVGNLIFAGIEIKSESKEAMKETLNQSTGESCIVLEALRQRKKGINAAWFKRYRKECFENTLNCQRRLDGKCRLKEEELSEMLEKLSERGILKKSGNKYFYMDWF